MPAAISISLNIVLPHEQVPNPYGTPELSFNFHYFAVRKMHFLMRARALAVFPGGFGTLDELFEVLTLVQTGRMARLPILLFGETLLAQDRQLGRPRRRRDYRSRRSRPDCLCRERRRGLGAHRRLATRLTPYSAASCRRSSTRAPTVATASGAISPSRAASSAIARLSRASTRCAPTARSASAIAATSAARSGPRAATSRM